MFSQVNVIRSCRLCSRRFSAPSTPYQEYTRGLTKKFLFQTHPDFFTKHPKLQGINATNLSHLQSIMDDPFSDASISDRQALRTLTFYLKSDEAFEPRRVKVALSRVIESICEILEAIGVDLPDKPPGFEEENAHRLHRQQSRYKHHQGDDGKSWLTTETLRTLQFIETVADRREILEIKRENMRRFKHTEEMVLTLTELKHIDYRNAWSMQHNAILLQQLYTELIERPQNFDLPWTGLTLVLGKDHIHQIHEDSRRIIDYLEGTITVDSLQVASIWIRQLEAIAQPQLRRMHQVHADLQRLRLEAQRCLQNLLYQLHQEQQRRFRAEKQVEVTVEIKRGFTCSQRPFGNFLDQFVKTLDVPSLASSSSSSTTIADKQNTKNVSSVLKKGDGSPSSSTNQESLLDDQHELYQLPFLATLQMCVEESHGTRLLSDGVLRIDAHFFAHFQHALRMRTRSTNDLQQQHESINDCYDDAMYRSDFGDEGNNAGHPSQQRMNERFGSGSQEVQSEAVFFLHILAEMTGFASTNELYETWVEGSLRRYEQDLERQAIEQDLVRRLRLQSLSRSSGVTTEQYTQTLVLLQDYLWSVQQKKEQQQQQQQHQWKRMNHTHSAQKTEASTAGTSAGVLRGLQGVRLQIGHFACVAEDGSCVLPWDLVLPQP